MLSPTLALCCPHCQHALSLPDIRGAAICPACAEPHGIPPAITDALALYERAIQQAIADLVREPTVPDPAPRAPTPPFAPPTPAPPVYAPHIAGPSILAAPVPAAISGYPATLLSIGPAPPLPIPGGPPAPAPKTSLEPHDTLAPSDSSALTPPEPNQPPALKDSSALTPPEPNQPPAPRDSAALAPPQPELFDTPAPRDISALPPLQLEPPAPPASRVSADSEYAPRVGAPPVPLQDDLFGPPISATGRDPRLAELADATGDPAERALADFIRSAEAPSESDARARSAVTEPGFAGFAGLSAHAAHDTLPGAPISAPSTSSILAILANRSDTALVGAPSGPSLAATPLQVAAVRELVPDNPPLWPAIDLVAAVRASLPDRPERPDLVPEPEGRIPASALVVARRALLDRHAHERRQQQIRDSSVGLVLAVLLCGLLLMFGYWYIAAPVAVLAIVMRLRREEHGERFGAEVQRLADALGGQRLPGHDAIAAWFDALWPAPVSPEAMWTSHLHGAIRCHIHGHPALLDVHLNEKAAGGILYPPRITAYLAAMWPGRVPSLRLTAPDLPPAAHARLTRLRKAGYTVTADPHGGLIMHASEPIAQAARADITRLPALQVPIGELADLAHDLGAEPIPAP